LPSQGRRSPTSSRAGPRGRWSCGYPTSGAAHHQKSNVFTVGVGLCRCRLRRGLRWAIARLGGPRRPQRGSQVRQPRHACSLAAPRRSAERPGSVPARSRCAKLVAPHGPRAEVRSPGPRRVRHRLGRRGGFGRPLENLSPVFSLLAPNRALRCTENPRVDGSIPSLATISKFMICMGFRASPADYQASFCPEIG